MKKVILFTTIALLSFASCKKCATCVTTVTYDYNGAAPNTSGTSTTEVCGSDAIKAAEGTTTATSTQSGITVTVTETTVCR